MCVFNIHCRTMSGCIKGTNISLNTVLQTVEITEQALLMIANTMPSLAYYECKNQVKHCFACAVHQLSNSVCGLIRQTLHYTNTVL